MSFRASIAAVARSVAFVIATVAAAMISALESMVFGVWLAATPAAPVIFVNRVACDLPDPRAR